MNKSDIKFLIKETLELILQESKLKPLQENVLLVEDKVSKNLQYHLDKNIPLHENAFRYGTEAQLQLFKEVRKLYNDEKLYLNPEDRWLVENTDIGNYGLYEDQFVPLDVPMIEEELEFNFYNYIPYSFSPDTNALNKEEHEVMMRDLKKDRIKFIDYIEFVNSMKNTEPVYKSIFSKLVNSNGKKLKFALDQDILLNDLKDDDDVNYIKLQKFKKFYEEYKESFPNWASENERLYKDVLKALNPSLNEADTKKKHPPLNKPKRGGSKKFYVYVKDPKTKKVKKVSFGAAGGGQNLAVKIRDPKARRAFAARQNCDKKKDRTTPGYWSCNIGRYWKSLGGGKNFSGYW